GKPGRFRQVISIFTNRNIRRAQILAEEPKLQMSFLSFSACSSHKATRRRSALTQPITCVAIFGQCGESQKCSEICSSRPSGPTTPDLTVTWGIPGSPYPLRHEFLRGSRNRASDSRRQTMPAAHEGTCPKVSRTHCEY